MPDAYIGNQSVPYYRINFLRLGWSANEGKEGCRCVHQVALSLGRLPPENRMAPLPPKRIEPKPVRKRKDAGDGLLTILHSIDRFKTWRDTPDLPKQLKAEKQQSRQVPPFDIQQIPEAMRKEGMPISAKLMERWFAGALNYSPTDADEGAELSQDGKPYLESMVDRFPTTYRSS